MHLDNSKLKTISEYRKTTLNNGNGGTGENNHRISPQNMDYYFSKITQAMNKVEELLFNNYESNQDSRIIVSECHESNDITTEDKVKLLSAQVESLQQLLLSKEAELQAAQEELNYINQDLAAALHTKVLTLAEAKGFAKNMLFGKQSMSECLAKLLSAVYHSTVEASELAPIDNIDNLTTSKSNNKNSSINNKLSNSTFSDKVLMDESIELRTRSIKLISKLAELKAKSKDIIGRTASSKDK